MRDLRPLFVAMFAANVLLLVGLAATVLGLALVVAGFPVAWLGWSGAVLTLAAIAARYLLARTMRPALDRMSEDDITTIYMPLLNEGTDVWRPVEAMKIGELGYMVTENAPPEEEWAFQPGHILRCEERQLSGGTHLVAVAKAT
ncbi:MAG TPA: hypothetical protein VFR36_08255 [Sphingomicrobium sp.]|nr:hypothetical protein [Sphingomicrobium sp.]